MAAAGTLLYAGKTSAGGSSAVTFVTSSVEFEAGKLYIIDIMHNRNSGTPGTSVPTSASATWDSVASNTFNTSGTPLSRRVSYRTAVGSTVTEAVTVTFSQDWNACAVCITEWSGTVAPGVNGIDAVVQVKSGRADATADLSQTFDVAVTAGNALHVHWASDGIAADTVTLNDGLTSISDQSETNENLRSVTAYHSTVFDTYHVSGTARDAAMLGIEIEAAASGSYGNKLYGPLGGKLVGKV